MSQIDSRILSFLSMMNERGVSDLHLASGFDSRIRKDGILEGLGEKIDAKDLENACLSLLDDELREKFKSVKEIDFALQIGDSSRFRVNLYRVNGGEIAAAIRKIPLSIPSLDELEAPLILKELVKKEKGLILVVGSTGSGKSTLLAAMLNEINLSQKKHIVTIEDPVEFIHESKNSLVSHRNIGLDTKSYSDALKYALRQDPDVILIGEMRDATTVSAAVSAAETGHLVFATLHTNSASQSINRIIDSFEGSEQNQIRNMLSGSLAAVISQTLVPRIGGGRVAVREILVNNFAIANLIRENKTHQILSQMQTNQNQTCMTTQAQALSKLFNEGILDRQSAIAIANDREEFLNLIGR